MDTLEKNKGFKIANGYSKASLIGLHQLGVCQKLELQLNCPFAKIASFEIK